MPVKLQCSAGGNRKVAILTINGRVMRGQPALARDLSGVSPQVWASLTFPHKSFAARPDAPGDCAFDAIMLTHLQQLLGGLLSGMEKVVVAG